jgi:hypothetical protein
LREHGSRTQVLLSTRADSRDAVSGADQRVCEVVVGGGVVREAVHAHRELALLAVKTGPKLPRHAGPPVPVPGWSCLGRFASEARACGLGRHWRVFRHGWPARRFVRFACLVSRWFWPAGSTREVRVQPSGGTPPNLRLRQGGGERLQSALVARGGSRRRRGGSRIRPRGQRRPLAGLVRPLPRSAHGRRREACWAATSRCLACGG